MKKRGIIDYIWFLLLAAGVLYGIAMGKEETVSRAAVEYSGQAVTLCIGLAGTMSLWMGIMEIARESGLVDKLSGLLRPLMKRLFPGVPENHEAMGAMAMNIAANMLGLGNAATPFGLKAMEKLDELNRKKGTATDDMILFLCINTASVTLIPSGVIAMRTAAGSENPAGIIGATLLASLISTAFGVAVCKIFRRK